MSSSFSKFLTFQENVSIPQRYSIDWTKFFFLWPYLEVSIYEKFLILTNFSTQTMTRWIEEKRTLQVSWQKHFTLGLEFCLEVSSPSQNLHSLVSDKAIFNSFLLRQQCFLIKPIVRCSWFSLRSRYLLYLADSMS